MNQQTAIEILDKLIKNKKGRWADVGAGSGLFTLGLDAVLESGSEIIALDKNPHILYSLQVQKSKLVIDDSNLLREYKLPELDGIVLANTLHVFEEKEEVLKALLHFLKPGGELIIVELDTNVPLQPWVPFPILLPSLKEELASLGRKVDQEIIGIPMLASQDKAYAVSVLAV